MAVIAFHDIDKKIYTIKDLYALPENQRAELIDGELYLIATPDMMHQRISGYLHNEIYNYRKILKSTFQG